MQWSLNILKVKLDTFLHWGNHEKVSERYWSNWSDMIILDYSTYEEGHFLFVVIFKQIMRLKPSIKKKISPSIEAH